MCRLTICIIYVPKTMISPCASAVHPPTHDKYPLSNIFLVARIVPNIHARSPKHFTLTPLISPSTLLHV